MIPSVKVPRIPLFFCKLGKFIVAIAKITLIILIAGYDFPMGTEFMERQNISIIIGAISMVIFIILDFLHVIFDEAANEEEQTPVSNIMFFISAGCSITACIMVAIMCVLPDIITIPGDPIEVTKQVSGKNTIQTNYIFKYLEAESDKPLYPINLEQSGVVILSMSSTDELFVRDFISNNTDLLSSHTLMFNNGVLNKMPETQDLYALEFYDIQTSMTELLESQNITFDVLYVGSPNLSNYSGEPFKHNTRLIVVTQETVTAEEKALLNKSFATVKVISIKTVK